MEDNHEKREKTMRWKLAILERDVHNKFVEDYVDRLPGQLNQYEGRILSYLVTHPGSGAGEVIDEFRLKKSTVSGIFKSLSDKGYIELASGKDDGRRKEIILKDSAYERQKQVALIFKEFDCVVQEGLTEEELAVFDKIFNKVENNLLGGKSK